MRVPITQIVAGYVGGIDGHRYTIHDENRKDAVSEGTGRGRPTVAPRTSHGILPTMNARVHMDDSPGPPVTVRWADDGAGLVVLDQTELPVEEVYRELRTLEDLREAIMSLRVRGAPLIGITAAMGVAALATARTAEGGGTVAEVTEWCRQLAQVRPTAVNLGWALERMSSLALGRQWSDTAELARALREEAGRILDQDRVMCRQIGEHALPLVDDGTSVLTHCNAGALATGGIGTALAPLYLAREDGRAVRVFSSETRPLLQGSRLTAWELNRSGIDVTIITDNMAGALFLDSPPDIVFVGADRIAANGDVANKVGTYGLAILAHHHGVPFYVLAPTSTVDLATPSGVDIPIEFRGADEVAEGFGFRTAPAGVRVWSPAFDVTPASLVSGIVTEQGVHTHPLGEALAEAVRKSKADQGGGHEADGEPEA